MAFHLKRIFAICATLMVIMQISKGQDEPSAATDENDDSSSEETVEDSNESRKRLRRSVETSLEGKGNVGENDSKAIPGLPDTQTLLRIAEILTTVGQQVLPLLVSGNMAVPEFIANRVTHNKNFLMNLKNEVDNLNDALKKSKK